MPGDLEWAAVSMGVLVFDISAPVGGQAGDSTLGIDPRAVSGLPAVGTDPGDLSQAYERGAAGWRMMGSARH